MQILQTYTEIIDTPNRNLKLRWEKLWKLGVCVCVNAALADCTWHLIHLILLQIFFTEELCRRPETLKLKTFFAAF